jgi:hypothetical protein
MAEVPPLASTGESAGRYYEAMLGCYTPYFRLNPLIWQHIPPGPNAVGGPCSRREDCRSHLCAQFAPITNRCTDFCNTDSDCRTPSTPNWRCQWAELSLTGVFLQSYDIADITRFVLVGVCSQ